MEDALVYCGGAHIYDLSDDEYSVIFSFLDTHTDIVKSILYVSMDFQCIALRTLQTVRLNSNTHIEQNVALLQTLHNMIATSGNVMRIKQLNLKYCSAELLSHLPPLFQPLINGDEEKVLIKELVLTFCKMSDEQFSESILPLSCVVHLNLKSVSSINPRSIHALTNSDMGKRLRILDLAGCFNALITNTGALEAICNNMTQLEEICLQGCNSLADHDFIALKNLTNLKKLDLTDTRITDAALMEILPVLCNFNDLTGVTGNLQELHLNCVMNATNKIWELLVALHEVPEGSERNKRGLKTLGVNVAATNAFIDSCCTMLRKLPTLEHIMFDRFNDAVVDILIDALLDCPNLTKLTVFMARSRLLSDESLEKFAQLYKLQEITLIGAEHETCKTLLSPYIKRVHTTMDS
jgi:hypothetical protein